MKKSSEKAKLDPRQITAARLIAAGHPKRAAAEQVDVAAQTVSRWLALPRFQAYLNQLAQAGQEEAHNHMRSLGKKAVATVDGLMGEDAPASIRLRAAQMVLNCIGMGDPKSEFWRIGPTSETQIAQRAAMEKHSQDLMDQLIQHQ